MLSLHYNGSSIYLYVNPTKIYQFNEKDSEIITHPLFLGNISKDFPEINIKKAGLNEYMWDFSVNFFNINVGAIQHIHKYLMTKIIQNKVSIY